MTSDISDTSISIMFARAKASFALLFTYKSYENRLDCYEECIFQRNIPLNIVRPFKSHGKSFFASYAFDK